MKKERFNEWYKEEGKKWLERTKKYLKNKDKWENNKLKGAISECLVEQMLISEDYIVYRFGYESAIQHLKNIRNFQKNSPVGKMIRQLPDFIVVSKEGEPNFVEVKYRKGGEFKKNDEENLKKLGENWRETIIILVSNKEPFFKITKIKDYLERDKFWTLENNPYLGIDKERLEYYKNLAFIYYTGIA